VVGHERVAALAPPHPTGGNGFAGLRLAHADVEPVLRGFLVGQLGRDPNERTVRVGELRPPGAAEAPVPLLALIEVTHHFTPFLSRYMRSAASMTWPSGTWSLALQMMARRLRS